MFDNKEIEFLSKQSRSNFCKLVSCAKQPPLCLVLGAGASASVGLPTWNKLLSRICYCYFDQWALKINSKEASPQKPPANTSVALTMGYDLYLLEKQHPEMFEAIYKATEHAEHWVNGSKLPEDISAQRNQQFINGLQLVNQLQDDFMKKIMLGDLTVIAQMIKNQIRPNDWDYLVRKSLYSSYEDSPFELEESLLYEQLIHLIEKLEIKKIINYNYDDTFYHSLKSKNIIFSNCYDYSKTNDKKVIYYPHGYIPMKGGVRTKIVLTEEDYQNQIYQQNLWSNNIQTSTFTTCSCIFVGLSLNDSNIRRLISMCSNTEIKKHFAFLPSSGVDTASVMYDSLCDSDLYRLGIRVIRYPDDNNHIRLPYLIKCLGELL